MAKSPSGERVAFGALEVPAAHSIVEERLYLLTVRCSCGGGPFQKVSQSLVRGGARTIDLVRGRCPRCAREREFRFDVTSFFGRFYPRRGVSDTDEPSQLLDAVAWVRWARLYMRAFEGDRAGLSSDDRADCGVLALRCLDEALKLFPRGEPSLREADLHSQGSRDAFRGGRRRYGRYELMGLKLEISMLLAAGGIDPDGGDPGLVQAGVVRLVEAVKRAGGDARTAGGAVIAALGLSGAAAAKALPAVPANAPRALLSTPDGGSRPPARRSLALRLAVLAAAAAAAAVALAIAW